jgi:beta-mannanase
MLATGFLSPGQAQAIASHCGPGVIWRPAWEFNQGTWFPNWNEASHAPSAWIAAFQSTVSAIRAADPRAVVIWNPNMGEGNNIKGYTTEQFYPGDAYVDWIGVDAYDFGGYGPNVQATINFAAAHGKPWSLPEWGLNGSDDTAYMHTMIGFIKNSPNCALQCYFSYPGPPNSDITQFPNCLAAYKAAF